MASLDLPRIRVAAVQASPVFLDLAATLDKLESLVADAAGRGADLVVFGETFVAGFPVWNGVLAPVDQHDLHQRLVEESIVVPGPETARIGRIAARHGVVVSVGVNERNPASLGQLWNANLVFDRAGRLVNHRRKLVGTWYERLTWSHGDAHDLAPVPLDGWHLGALICGENTNTLARFTLLAQGERVHIATYPPAWPFDARDAGVEYDLEDSIRLRSAAHSFEGKVFSVVAATALGDDAVAAVAAGDARVEKLLTARPTASLVVGPTGATIAGPLVGVEGILCADLDLREEIVAKQAHDIVGTYTRADVFQLSVDTRRHTPLLRPHATQPLVPTPPSDVPAAPRGGNGAMGSTRTAVTIPSEVPISGTLFEPPRTSGGARPPVVVLCHGFSGARYGELPERLTEIGVALLTFDFRSYGGSGGERGRVIMEEQVADTIAAMDWIEERRTLGPIILLGSSLGGSIAIDAAARDRRVAACISTCPIADGADQLRSRCPDDAEWEQFLGRVEDGDRFHRFEIVYIPEHLRAHLPADTPMDFSADTVASFLGLRPIERVREVAERMPFLLVHARDDEVVSFDHSEALAAEAGEDCRFAAVDAGNHFLLAQPEVLELLADWLAEQGFAVAPDHAVA